MQIHIQINTETLPIDNDAGRLLEELGCNTQYEALVEGETLIKHDGKVVGFMRVYDIGE